MDVYGQTNRLHRGTSSIAGAERSEARTLVRMVKDTYLPNSEKGNETQYANVWKESKNQERRKAEIRNEEINRSVTEKNRRIPRNGNVEKHRCETHRRRRADKKSSND